MSDATQTRKCAIVTGGSRGIGAAVVEALARDGHDIVINYAARAEAAEELARSVSAAYGIDTLCVQGDVSSFDEAKALVDAAMERFGRIDVLVNNAGITPDGLLMRMSEEAFDQVLSINLKGAFNMMRHASGIMARQRSGRIVNISSVVGLMGNAGQVNYAASKAGLLGMTKSVAREFASRNVTANAIAPGFIETDMTAALPEKATTELSSRIPLGRLGKAQDVAEAVAFLASDKAGYITGQTLVVDGGMVM